MTQEADMTLYALDQYRREVSWIPALTSEEEAQLLHCIRCSKGERSTSCPDAHMCMEAQRAYTRLVEGYQSLVLRIARRYERHCREMDLLDLVQEGNEGLLHAIERHNGNQDGLSFSTWAFSWIRGMMYRALLREGAMYLPRRKGEAIRQMGTVGDTFYCVLGRQPTVEEMAGAMGMTEREIRELVVLKEQQVVSLFLPQDQDGEMFLEDVLEDHEDSSSADDGFSSVGDVLGTLTEREQMVIRLRYGFVDGRVYTQKEVADQLGVTSSRVAVLERRAKLRLRKALESHSG
jgi:RNA polymerase primary sigma factor